jgi:TolB-like protein/class 3 adenylate cyclase/Flp pilus assembly protein TadD
MAEERTQRRLAAILAADVVGYGRLMGADETGTLAALKAHRREMLDVAIAAHQGRIVKLTGDGMLVEFPSVVNAVTCAAKIQEQMRARNAAVPEVRRIEFRIGVNLGDVIIEGDDIYGDGVNIAARIESLADPNGVCVSRVVRDQVLDKLDLAFDDMGEQQLKNIARPVQVFRMVLGGVNQAMPRGSPNEQARLALPDRPSIAVLPFENMSGDAEQEYFADGVVEEIITALSRFRGLFVIARNSSFTYKGRAVDVKQVGRELGVRYVLEGSVRKAASKVRITGQLIDATTATHLWADRFDGNMEDIFDLQDHVTASVVGAIAPKLEEAEIERARRKPTESLHAYEYFLRGMAELHQWSREGNDKALAHFYRAIQLDPNYAAAHGMAARAYVQRNAGGWMRDRAKEVAETERLARRAVELGRDDAVALCTAGFALADILGNVDDGAALIDRALELNPNLAWAWLFSGWANVIRGNAEKGIECVARAMRLSPQDPQVFSMQTAIAFGQFVLGRYDEALSWAEKARRERPSLALPTCIVAASAALSGRLDDARSAMAVLRRLDPDLGISNVNALQVIKRPEDLAKWTEALRRAGLPE